MRDGAGLVLRRARTQARLLTAVLAVVVVGATLLGLCTLLLTTGQQQARAAALRQVPADQLTAEVVLSDLADDPAGAVQVAAAALAEVLAPVPARTATWVTSTVRPLPPDAAGAARLGWLAAIDDVADSARLDTGRWAAPTPAGGPWEAALPTAAAERLGISVGDRVDLGATTRATGQAPAGPVSVVVVGTFTPLLDDGAWSRDLIGGAGWVPTLDFGYFRTLGAPAFGPFVVPAAPLLGAAGLSRVSVLARPDVLAAAPDDLDRALTGLATGRRTLSAALGDRDVAARLEAELPGVLATVAAQQAVTGATVLVVTLVGLALTGTALGVAGRLVAGRRAAEAALLAARGGGPRALAAAAAGEALVIALLATALALPLALLLYRWLQGLPVLADAGLTGPVRPTAALVGAVSAVAVLLAVVLVLPAVRPAAAEGRRSPRGAVIRSGADLLLVGLAAVGFLQLRDHPVSAAAGIDPVLVGAPVACLLAGSVLALRVVPLVSAAAEWTARRSRGAVSALAAWGTARRPHAGGATFLLVLATAAATFGVGFAGTWSTSQSDQAAVRVGTDVAVPAVAEGLLGQGAAVAAATGGAVLPVSTRPVSLGSVIRTGPSAVPTRLVALDTTRADDVVRGRVPGAASWSAATRDLAPDVPAAGVRLPAGSGGPAVTVTGTSSGDGRSARPVLLVVDAAGARSALAGEVVPLDGRPHPVVLRDGTGAVPADPGELTVVGVDLDLAYLDEDAIDYLTVGPVDVAVAVELPGASAPEGGAEWSAGAATGGSEALSTASVTVADSAGGATVTAQAEVSLFAAGGQYLRLVTTGYLPPATVPVLITRQLADAVGAVLDDGLAMAVGGVSVTARVVGVLDHLPSVPAGPGVLADLDALSRSLAGVGDTADLTQSWWAGGVADPAAAVDRLAAAGLPGAVSRTAVADELRDGPLSAGVPVAVWLLVATAATLALAGTVLATLAALDSRAVEVARLQGMGMPRRAVATALVAEHAVLTTLAVLLGAALGAVAAVFLAPLMTVSDTGSAPVPSALPQWPWGVESALVLGLLVACTAVALPVAAALSRRAVAEHLRLDGAA